MGWFFKKENKSELTLAIEKLESNASAENQENFAKILNRYVESGTWIYMPIHQDEKGYRLKIVASRGGHYAAMCSDSDKIKKDKGFDALNTDINKIFDSVFENENINGIVINPYTSPLFLDKGFLLKCLIHAKYPTQNVTTHFFKVALCKNNAFVHDCTSTPHKDKNASSNFVVFVCAFNSSALPRPHNLPSFITAIRSASDSASSR